MEKIHRNQTEVNEYYRRPNGSLGIRTINLEPTRTQQQFKEECDVNNIIKKYKKGQPITHINTNSGTYADLAEVPDYRDAMQTVINANAAFDALPSNVRYKFKNDPQELINFLRDPKNKEEAIKLGLATPRKEAETTLSDIAKELKETRVEAQKRYSKPKPKIEEEE